MTAVPQEVGTDAAAAGVSWDPPQLMARLREPPFWIVQVGVALITALHVGVEATGLSERHDAIGGLAHLPILLYVLPVVYAGLHFGIEGGLWSGLSVAVLAAPNLLFWHGDGWGWVAEAGTIAVVVAVGVAVSVPVERERQQRAQAERAGRHARAVGRRLALMNDVTSALVRGVDLQDALRRVLHRMIVVMDLHTAAVVTRDPEQAPVVRACHSTEAGAVGRLGARVDALPLGPDGQLRWPAAADAHEAWVPFPTADGVAGALVVESMRRGLTDRDRDLLGAIAAQIGVSLDNARMQAAEKEALHGYLRAVTRAQEEERRRIARQLHDVATHELLLLGRELEQVGGGPSAPASVSGRLSDVIEALRRFGRELRPSVLDPLGLAPALEWLCQQTDERTAAMVRFNLRGDARRLGDEVELALYRMAEEALRNAERHAGATCIDVMVEFGPAEVTIEVCDDGHGFVVPERLDAFVDDDGLGLVGMRERAALVGATLDLHSAPGHGTRVAVRLAVPGRPGRSPAPSRPSAPVAGTSGT